MASSEQKAGHAIAIRVGGRRMSQSNPVRSPTKGNQSSPSASPDDATDVQQPVPDYPRPRSPQASSDAKDGTAEEESSSQQGNRQERRRQERRKDKYQTEEDKSHGLQHGFPYDVKHSSKDAKGPMGADKVRRSSLGAGGMRITQPVGKFMA